MILDTPRVNCVQNHKIIKQKVIAIRISPIKNTKCEKAVTVTENCLLSHVLISSQVNKWIVLKN